MNWCCPKDGEALARHEERLRCPTCQTEYSVVHGVPFFPAASSDRLPVPIPQLTEDDDLPAELWRLMQDHSADDAAHRFCNDRGCVRYRPGADWKSILPAKRGTLIVEIGPGYGDHAVELARTGPTAVLVHDLTAARIVDRRLREASAEAAHVALSPRLDRLPLADSSVGAIALEAAAMSSFGLTSASFDDFARELSRVVSDGGTVFVGIPNALDRLLGFGRLRARMQSRSSSPSFAAILQQARSPRRPGPGEGSIVRSMRRNGFRGPDVYAPLPNERDVQVVLPVDDARVVRYFLNNLIRRNSVLVRAGIGVARFAVGLGLFGSLVPYRYLFFTRDNSRDGAGK